MSDTNLERIADLVRESAVSAQADFQFSRIISRNDQMWNTGKAWYFDVGLSALTCIRHALNGATPAAILDLPCGHGRVCRMLRAAYPNAHLTVCDLDKDGVDFCAETFGAEPVYSSADIRKVRLERRFDLIWCGSLLTHIQRDEWKDFLAFFEEHLNPGGVLLFTTHGRQAVRFMRDGTFDYGLSGPERDAWIEQYVRDGFGWAVPSGQTYGHSLSAMSFVSGLVQRMPGLALTGYQEAGWSNHQDAVACTRLPVAFPTA